jgi:hypothetical protein
MYPMIEALDPCCFFFLPRYLFECGAEVFRDHLTYERVFDLLDLVYKNHLRYEVYFSFNPGSKKPDCVYPT